MAALDSFGAAWMGLVAEIEGDAEPLLRFYDRHASSMQQDPYKTGIALSVEVPASAWRWPAYVTQVEVPQQAQSEDAPCCEDYRDRCLHFVRRWRALACRARNVVSFRESAQAVPGMTAKLLPSGGFREHCECEQLEGGPFPVESPLLMQYAPCSRIDCGCCWAPVVPGWTSMVRR